MTKMKQIVVAILLAVLLAGCFGQFALVRKVYTWNAEIGDRFARSIVFWIGGVFLPVYGLAAFADFVVFNTLEFWTGNNPINTGRIDTKKTSDAEVKAIRTRNAQGEPMIEFRFQKRGETTILHVARADDTHLRMTVFSPRHPTQTHVVRADALSAERAATALTTAHDVDGVRL